MNNVYLYGFDGKNKGELRDEVFFFSPFLIVGADPDRFIKDAMHKINGEWVLGFGEGPFVEYDFQENEDEEECILNPYYIQFARFAAYLAKLAIRFDCDVEFVLHFEYAMKSETGVAGMDVAFDSREDRRLFSRLNMEDGSQKEVAYLPFEITG